jgi:hypothetical protein
MVFAVFADEYWHKLVFVSQKILVRSSSIALSSLGRSFVDRLYCPFSWWVCIR